MPGTDNFGERKWEAKKPPAPPHLPKGCVEAVWSDEPNFHAVPPRLWKFFHDFPQKYSSSKNNLFENLKRRGKGMGQSSNHEERKKTLPPPSPKVLGPPILFLQFSWTAFGPKGELELWVRVRILPPLSPISPPGFSQSEWPGLLCRAGPRGPRAPLKVMMAIWTPARCRRRSPSGSALRSWSQK